MQTGHPPVNDGGNAMQFGYFTLSDNRYPNNPRQAEDFIKDIYAEALYAEKIGLNSAWIGEHHFNLLGVNASPLAILAQLAGATTKLRLAHPWRSPPPPRPSSAWPPP